MKQASCMVAFTTLALLAMVITLVDARRGRCEWEWAESKSSPQNTVGFRNCKTPFLNGYVPTGTPGQGENPRDFTELCRNNEYFATLYDTATKTPAWGAYRVDYAESRLSRKSTGAKWKFDNVFQPDEQTALDTDCYRTAENERLWDRGHVVPSHAMSTSKERASATFQATNSAPQPGKFNSNGNWNTRESQVVEWTTRHKESLYVVTGTHYDDRSNPKKVGAHGVEDLKLNSPDYYWNAICDGKESLAWWGSNDVDSDHLDLWALRTVDQLTDKFGVKPFENCNTHKRASWAGEFPVRKGSKWAKADSDEARQRGLAPARARDEAENVVLGRVSDSVPKSDSDSESDSELTPLAKYRQELLDAIVSDRTKQEKVFGPFLESNDDFFAARAFDPNCEHIFADGYIPPKGDGEVELCRNGKFATLFDPEMKTPKWSAYVAKKGDRVDRGSLAENYPSQCGVTRYGMMFYFDPLLVEDQQAQNSPCPGQGWGRQWNRGHLAPSNALGTSIESMWSTYATTNTAAQYGPFNSHAWCAREHQIVDSANYYGTDLYVITGVHYDNRRNPRTVEGRQGDGLAVPSYYYSVVCDLTQGKSLGWYGRNAVDAGAYPEDMKTLRTVAEIEEKFDVDLFPRAACGIDKPVDKDYWKEFLPVDSCPLEKELNPNLEKPCCSYEFDDSGFKAAKRRHWQNTNDEF